MTNFNFTSRIIMIKQLIAAASLAVIATASHAAEPGKAYGGIDVGTSRFEHGLTQTSYGAFAGYQFTPTWAVEGGYRRLYDSAAFGAKTNGDQLALSVLGSYPLGESLSVYGRLGVNRLTEEVKLDGYAFKDHMTRVLPGIGLSYKLSNQLSARVEVQQPESKTTNLSTGLSYSF
jgi:OmpA-OmpF porin, OOP family